MEHLLAFIEKMEKEGLPGVVIDTFAHYYRQIVAGASGLIPEVVINPLGPDDIPDADGLTGYATAGQQVMENTVMIVLNGGLGTSMGLTGAKSLLEVKNGRSFLDIVLAQGAERKVRLAFMNSFSTHEQTVAAVARIDPETQPLFFLQHKFPKVLKNGYAPAVWPENPKLEWNPPGHGDIYTALNTSGLLQKLLAEGITYAFIANGDNLAATLETSLLGYFAENDFPFMMEAAERTTADRKGGHLARHRNGGLMLREIAQCPEDTVDCFQDIERHRFFNTNNLWVNLKKLDRLFKEQAVIRLPMILNKKTLDPRNPLSPPVFQIETAMGTAVSLFQDAAAIKVPTSRFFPVKKCDDLLTVRSDCFVLTKTDRLVTNPKRSLGRINVSLDPEFYGKIDGFDQRFAAGVPSLVDCESLVIEGDVFFEGGVTIVGRVRIKNRRHGQRVVKQGTVIDRDIVF